MYGQIKATLLSRYSFKNDIARFRLVPSRKDFPAAGESAVKNSIAKSNECL